MYVQGTPKHPLTHSLHLDSKGGKGGAQFSANAPNQAKHPGRNGSNSSYFVTYIYIICVCASLVFEPYMYFFITQNHVTPWVYHGVVHVHVH